MIFIDSSYFIARVDKADRWHRRALEIPESMLADGVVSDYVILETVTVVGHRKGGKEGCCLYDFFMDNFEVVYVDEDILERSMKIYLEYGGALSVADAVAVEIMSEHNIKKIVSFDADFDKVPGILRVH
ncbi:MAG: type II toxin-antitoxin system VapC family toxin [Candidatus Hadarchaeales archaeon]